MSGTVLGFLLRLSLLIPTEVLSARWNDNLYRGGNWFSGLNNWVSHLQQGYGRASALGGPIKVKWPFKAAFMAWEAPKDWEGTTSLRPPQFALVMDGLMERFLYIRSGPFFSTIWQKPPLLTPASTNHCLFVLSSAESKNVPVSFGFSVPQEKLYSLCIMWWDWQPILTAQLYVEL